MHYYKSLFINNLIKIEINHYYIIQPIKSFLIRCIGIKLIFKNVFILWCNNAIPRISMGHTYDWNLIFFQSLFQLLKRYWKKQKCLKFLIFNRINYLFFYFSQLGDLCCHNVVPLPVMSHKCLPLSVVQCVLHIIWYLYKHITLGRSKFEFEQYLPSLYRPADNSVYGTVRRPN